MSTTYCSRERNHRGYRYAGPHSQRLVVNKIQCDKNISAETGLTNYSSTESNVASKVDIARNGQVVQLNDLRDLLEALLELGNLHTKATTSISANTGIVIA